MLQSIPGFKEEQGTLTIYHCVLTCYRCITNRCILLRYYTAKTQQLGVLKAIGTKNSYLANSLVVQALFLSVVAMVISIVLVQGLEQILPAGMPFLLTTPMIAQYAAIFIVISILGTLISLYQVLKVDALEAIGGGM